MEQEIKELIEKILIKALRAKVGIDPDLLSEIITDRVIKYLRDNDLLYEPEFGMDDLFDEDEEDELGD